jgi:[ribosomal protein S5]-alanine N-acetyltransferase
MYCMKLKTHRLVLREITSTDIPLIHQLNSIPEVDQYNTLGLPANYEVTENIILPLITAQQELPRLKYIWAVEDLHQNFMGLFGLNLGVAKYQSAEIWYKYFPIYWNKGYATEAVNAALKFGFEELHLHRIHAGCATENIGSIKVLEKSGFKREGYHKKILPIRGNWIDNYEYAILEEEYFNTL